MIICTPDIFFHPISVMDFKKIFSVVVCAVGIFFSMTAESKDGCLNSYVSADSLLLYEYYESHIWVSPLNYPRVFSGQGDRASCSCAEEANLGRVFARFPFGEAIRTCVAHVFSSYG